MEHNHLGLYTLVHTGYTLIFVSLTEKFKSRFGLEQFEKRQGNPFKKTSPDSDKSEFPKERHKMTEGRKSSAKPIKNKLPEQKATAAGRGRLAQRGRQPPVWAFLRIPEPWERKDCDLPMENKAHHRPKSRC